MKKANVFFKALGITAMAGSIALFAACSNESTTQTSVNEASATNAVSQSATAKKTSLEEAIEIALKNADIAREDARFTKTSIDSDDVIPHYEIEFVADGKEYDYDIAVNDGKILEADKEKEDDISFYYEPLSKESAVPATKAETKANNGYVSVDEAKRIALNAAGINEADAEFKKANFDTDDRIAHYDIEFYSDGYEYDYEISAADGKILDFDKEKDRNGNQMVIGGNNYIEADVAYEKVLAHAKLKASDVGYYSVSLSADKRLAYYEFEFKAGDYEYEYKVNAETGEIISSEKDFND